jgi:3',5'-cyclic AMP phosphodiesterase CpdA
LSLLLAHLSDPHVGPVPRPRLRELAGKRLTGYMNWMRGRHLIHDMEMLEKITVDHVALTGDLVNIGMEKEFMAAQRYVSRLGDADFVSIIPGNHDAYVRSSYTYMRAATAPWMTGDGTDIPGFPYIRIRQDVALIGLSSGVPTAPLLASGELGKAQLAGLADALDEAKEAGLMRVIMIHHPPVHNGASFGRGLRDARSFEKVIAKHGAELVIHGHNHRHSVAHIKCPDGKTPVVGVASASAVPGSPKHLAAYHLYNITRSNGRVAIDMRVRGLLSSGGIGDVERIVLTA